MCIEIRICSDFRKLKIKKRKREITWRQLLWLEKSHLMSPGAAQMYSQTGYNLSHMSLSLVSVQPDWIQRVSYVFISCLCTARLDITCLICLYLLSLYSQTGYNLSDMCLSLVSAQPDWIQLLICLYLLSLHSQTGYNLSDMCLSLVSVQTDWI